jgi:ring-1,2-phenylacetyl-CoA epoxidase subunit PaaE
MAQFYSFKVSQIKRETHDSVSISFDIDSKYHDDFRYVPGQYITIKVNVDGEDCRRSYSISSSRSEKLTIGIKKVEGGKVSNFMNEKLSVGDYVEISAPQGNFKLENIDPKNTRKFVAFAAGSGITPILSMIKEISHNEIKSEFLLFYSNKTRKDIMFQEDINSLSNENISTKFIFTREDAEKKLYNGRINESKALDLMRTEMSFLNADAFFLCGPEEMIFSSKKALESLGVDKEKIKFELFTTPVKKDEEVTAETLNEDFDGNSKVTVICDDEEVDFDLNKDGDSILDAAMEQDLDVPFSCKGAVCCTCKAKVTKGKVTMDANYALSDQEVEDGYILSCQAHPASEEVTVDFDF